MRAAAIQTHDRPAIDRRSFLFTTTAVVGAAGAVAAGWPLIDQMNMDARTRATADVISFDATTLHPAEQRQLRWRNFPVFVVRRTPATLAAMQEPSFVTSLKDADSRMRQQPTYVRNWHRSIDPIFAVLVGICTKCACVPSYSAETSVLTMAGGYACPCCASHYDPAGRVYSGISQYNLPVPPYAIDGRSQILLGKNPPGELFTFESIEQI
jgi:ubiquinol-cytochrome c reductase iron-sulfur subunit